jgi:hypothetical protein
MSPLKISRRFDMPLNLRHAKALYGRKSIVGNPQLDGAGAVLGGNGVSQAEIHDQLTGLAARSIATEDLSDYVENRDPWKVRIPRVGRTALERLVKKIRDRRAVLSKLADADLPLRARLDMVRLGRELTPIELNDHREEEEAKRLDAFHREQAMRGRRRIINTLTRLKHCHIVRTENTERVKAEVRIMYAEYCSLYYRYYVDARTLPYGVSITDILGDDICTDLSAACEHPVRSQIKQITNQIVGLFYTIEIAATMGVPNQCKFSDLLPLMPTSAPPLAFLTGYAEGKRVRYGNLEDMPHFLGGGQTKGGKSNEMHVMACTLIARNSPDDLRMLMIDLKFNGIEMGRYKGIPHMVAKHDISAPGSFVEQVPDGIAKTPEDAIYVLRWLLAESNRRGKMFAKEELQNLRQWNRKHPNRKLPYLVLINDELALLRVDQKHGKESYNLIQEIISTARAAGISFVTFTQSSTNRVIDEFIKINLPGRMCFSVPDVSSSVLFVGDGSAINLMPAGRAIYKHGTEKYLVQTPLIEPKDISEIVANARLGKKTGHLTSRPVIPEEIISWSIEHNESRLTVRDVYARFGGELQRIDLHSVESILQEMEGQTYVVDEKMYQILPGIGRKPRIVVHIDAATEATVSLETRDETRDTTLDTSKIPCPYCGAPRSLTPCEWCRMGE